MQKTTYYCDWCQKEENNLKNHSIMRAAIHGDEILTFNLRYGDLCRECENRLCKNVQGALQHAMELVRNA